MRAAMESKQISVAHGHTLRRGLAFRRHPATARMAIIMVLFAIWEIAARGFVDPLFLSPPSRVVSALYPLLRSAGVVKALMLAFWELAAAFLISVVIGIAV